MTRRNRMFSCAVVLLGTVALGVPGGAQEPKKLTPERIAAEPPLGGVLPTDLAWHPDGKRLSYLRPTGGNGADLWVLEVASGRESLLVAGSKVMAPPAPGAGPAKPLPLRGYAWSPRGDTLLVPAGGDLFLVDADDGGVRALTRTPETEESPEFSPDGRRIAFVRKNDLYVVEVAGGRETRLTRTGSDTMLNGRLDWVYEEELASRSGKAYTWSPDSRSIGYLQLDQARVPTFPIVDFLPVQNTVQVQRYPKAGSPNSIVRVGLVGLGGDGAPGPERLVSFDPDDMYVVPDLAFSPDSETLAFQYLSREQNDLQLRFLPVPDSPAAALGKPRTVIAERSQSWVDHLGPPVFLKDGRRFLWLSERDGFAHAYLCETDGACRAITSGPWMVDKLLRVDERTGFIYFTSTEKDPRERHLYRARLDGTGRARLTREDGTHAVQVSPDARFYADTWSDVTTPPRIWVTTPDATRRVSVDENRSPDVLQYELGRLEWVDLKARDGTPLHARMLTPDAFDPARRYPVVVSVYGGPGAQMVRNAWNGVSLFERLLASRGYLVWALDNRGSAGRGHVFERPIFHDLGKIELEDQLVGVDYLKSLPFVDGARLAITGWSYGGYMTLYALTRAPDVFRAGAAGAPVTDWKLYDTIYTERYMGTPQSNPKGYETSSPLVRAGDLTAAVMLLHGTADDNVHLANTVDFVDALIKAGKPYSLQIHPRQMHGFAGKDNRISRDSAILGFFEAQLKP